MPNKTILQCNIGRSWDAQHLLAKYMEKLNVGICAVSEPRHVPSSPFWFSSDNGLAAIHWRRCGTHEVCRKILGCRDMVAVEWSGVYVVACYISPNVPHTEFLEFVDDLDAVIGCLGGRTIVCGDFNSKSLLWGCSHTNNRGRILEEWAAERDIRLVNTGNVPTCVRPQGH